MTPTFDGSPDDPSLRHALGGPPAQAVTGELDELPDVLDELAPETELVLDDDDERHVTVSQLRDFNRDNVRYPPAMPRLGDGESALCEIAGEPDVGTFVLLMTAIDRLEHLSLVRQPDMSIGVPSDFSPSGNSALGTAPADELDVLVDADDWPQIIAFLEQQIFTQRRLLERLRVVAGAHRDAVQNAVDTVQTKRLDVLEGKDGPREEVTLEGAVMAFVVEVALNVIPGAIAGPVLLRLTAGLLTLTRRTALAAAGKAVTAAAAQQLIARDKELQKLQRQLQGLLARLSAEPSKRERSQVNRKKGEVAAKARERRDAELLESNYAELREAIAIRARDDASRVVTALSENQNVVRAGQATVTKVAGSMAKPIGDPTPPPQAPPSQADLPNGVGPGATGMPIPIDIAMKIQVQDFFDGWLYSVELGCQTLEDFAFLARHYQVLPAAEEGTGLDLDSLLKPVPKLQQLMDEWDGELAGMSAFRARLETDYELMLWVLMYYDVFLKGPLVGPMLVDTSPRTIQRNEVPPDVDKRVLNYLKLRFFPGSQMQPVDTLTEMQQLAQKINDLLKTEQPPSSPQPTSEGGPPSPVVREILKTVQVGRQSLGPGPAQPQ